MNKRVLKVVGLLAALLLTFAGGAAVGGGIVFAATKARTLDQEQATVPHQLDPEPGIVVAYVAPDGPAAEAGLKRGDILLKINDEAIDHAWELIHHLNDLESGDQVKLTVLHGDEERTLTATLGDRDGRPYLGIVPCSDLPAEPSRIMLHMRFPGTHIIEVMSDSPADRAGLEVGDLIVAVDGQELDAERSLTDLITAHAPGDSVTLEVMRPGEETREVTVRLGEHPEKEGVAYLGVQYLPAPHAHRFEGRPLPFDIPPYETRPFEFEDEMFFFPEGDVQQGAIVRRVADDSPAEAAGLEGGDIITAIDNEPVNGPYALANTVAEHEPGDVLTLSVYRPESEETLEIEVTLAEHPGKKGKAYLGVLTVGFFRIQRFGGKHEPPRWKDPEHRFEFELHFDEPPFELETEPHWFDSQFQTLPDGCCDDVPSSTV